MKCTICSIRNKELVNKIESILYAQEGVLSTRDRRKLKEQFPDNIDEIEAISDNDCQIHYNFHQTINTGDPDFDLLADEKNGEEENSSSLIKDIGKKEGSLLGGFLTEQLATFNCLTAKINKAIEESETEDMNKIIIHPVTAAFYKDCSISIRDTLKEIRDMNADLNGSKSDSLSGLKSLVSALTPSNSKSDDQDLTTSMYDAEVTPEEDKEG